MLRRLSDAKMKLQEKELGVGIAAMRRALFRLLRSTAIEMHSRTHIYAYAGVGWFVSLIMYAIPTLHVKDAA
eukprot:scaffold22893_cov130-Skeletonema_dohrnii-CCMP3373.AAC.1